ncbi:hypothetical protein SAMN05444682_105343 [Parapedobacter indicus]|uniref:Uncharacterized protein n=1 Tax=Parapedobacter indicus TaxID=1477437 RepID=A0A1I3KZP1_9SPHI|nr:hypothetical protein CLV26_105343 [Parapedobacter indicus]SFI77565.1 hypothetical protein SAMN05444682_105343 [Parapedobacter indicus]
MLTKNLRETKVFQKGCRIFKFNIFNFLLFNYIN